MEQLQANFKLAVYIFTLITILFVVIIAYLIYSVDELEKQIQDVRGVLCDDSRQENACRCEFILPKLENDYRALQGIVEEQQKKIENMTFCYASLDEVLKQMGIKAQKRYEKKVGE